MSETTCRCSHDRDSHLAGTLRCQNQFCRCTGYNEPTNAERAQERAFKLWDTHRKEAGRDPSADGMALLMRSATWVDIGRTQPANASTSRGTMYGQGDDEKPTLFGMRVIATNDRALNEGDVLAVFPSSVADDPHKSRWQQANDRAYMLWDEYKRRTQREPAADGMALLMRTATWVEVGKHEPVSTMPARGTMFEQGDDKIMFGMRVVLTNDPTIAEGDVRAVFPVASSSS